MNSGIYIIEFPDGSFYIGQSVDMYARWKEHNCSFLISRASRRMQHAFNNAGAPEYRVLLKCHPDYLDMFEAYFIHKLQPNLNTNLPSAFRYAWDEIEQFINNAETLSPLTTILADNQDLLDQKYANESVTKQYQDAYEKTSTIAEELELEVIQLKRLLKEPDAVEALRKELKASREAYWLVDKAFWEERLKVSTYNSKPWWKRLWTRI